MTIVNLLALLISITAVFSWLIHGCSTAMSDQTIDRVAAQRSGA